ncbi:condensation domain-containing protein, partial [Mucilaginibacter calamicampi]
MDKGSFKKPGHWNQSFLIRVPELETSQLESALKTLVGYHDVLRMQYLKEASGWKQRYTSEPHAPTLQTQDISRLSEAGLQELLTSWQSGF